MDHRGRSHYSSSHSEPRHRSLGRQTLDKLEDAMESLQLAPRGRHAGYSDTNALEVIPYHAGRHHHHHHTRSPSHHHHERPHRRRHHSASPTRHHHRHRSSPSSSSSYSSTHRGRPSSRSDRDDGSRSRSRWGHGLQASVEAAAIEAFRLRNEPGAWKGAKAGRVATAALSAGVIGVAAEHRRERRSSDDHHLKKSAHGAAVAGLAVNRLVNGPRREVGYYD